jgi:hypothetical protein
MIYIGLSEIPAELTGAFGVVFGFKTENFIIPASSSVDATREQENSAKNLMMQITYLWSSMKDIQ